MDEQYELEELKMQQALAIDDRRRIQVEQATLTARLTEVNEQLADIVVDIADREREAQIDEQKQRRNNLKSA